MVNPEAPWKRLKNGHIYGDLLETSQQANRFIGMPLNRDLVGVIVSIGLEIRMLSSCPKKKLRKNELDAGDYPLVN